MPTKLKKENLPACAYMPTLIDGEIVMFNPAIKRNNGDEGFGAYYPHIDEVRFISFKEIAEHLMTALCEDEETKPKDSPGRKARPVTP